MSRERLLTHAGKTMNVREWADYVGVNYGTLRDRLNNGGWSVGQSLGIIDDGRKSRQ